MDAAKPVADELPAAPAAESNSARQKRIDHEAALLAEARASAAAGRTVSEDQVDAWIDSLDSDKPLPMPRSGH
jgi:predicted transcriptional regulator